VRIDVVTIFPDYLAPLDLSLIGKARADGLVTIGVHDLRDVTTDRHRTVDDTPSGGGAGMVMRADVWGQALDPLLADGGTLAIPTPSGAPLTQRAVEDLAASGGPLVIACGRYEGIDARVAEHYASRDDVTVMEFSLGDYVLNGGEVAAMALTEGVVRLLPGVVGNPDSLEEESHAGDGTLEYPVYTRPETWRGLEIPAVLTSGDHGAAAAWRREQSLARTASRRPDILHSLDVDALDPADRRTLASLGYVVPAGAASPVPVTVRDATPADGDAVAALAAVTFPLAGPPGTSREDIDSFVATHLTPRAMAEHAERATSVLRVAWVGQVAVGYTLCLLPATVDEPPYAADVAACVTARPAAELSKVYVLPEYMGSGLASLLMTDAGRAVRAARVEGEPVAALWLGTNSGNKRAQKAYRRSGFTRAGRRTFRVGETTHSDVVMVLDLTREGD
jgi:tRNA (guanine37-N1)-methyltransferase